MITSFQVVRNDLATLRWCDEPSSSDDLADGQISVEISRVAFTSNNVTYARLGEQIPYWDYFPADKQWGRIPVWGLGTVSRSRNPNVSEGEGVYGFFPMDSRVVLQPGARALARFVDETPHRRKLPPTYNEYVLIDRDRTYRVADANSHLVLRPLFSVSFFCAAYLSENGYFGARQIVITSASSKAALGMAFLLNRDRAIRDAFEIVGLTSPANVDFVKAARLFDQVAPYEAIDTLSFRPSVLIDISGAAAARAAVHRRLGDALAASLLAGFTHWNELDITKSVLPGPKPTLFFTPDHILRLRREWGPDRLRERLAEAWRGFLGFVDPWLEYQHATMHFEVESAYRAVLAGRVPANRAHILTVRAESEK